MTEDEILGCAREAVAYGYGTVVLQAGEDHGLTRDWIAGVVRRIKAETGLAVTLSLGERSLDDLRAWREAGADRYLLRFETSDPDLYRRIHPPGPGRRGASPIRPTASTCCASCATWATRSAAASWWASPGRPTRSWPATSSSSARWTST